MQVNRARDPLDGSSSLATWTIRVCVAAAAAPSDPLRSTHERPMVERNPSPTPPTRVGDHSGPCAPSPLLFQHLSLCGVVVVTNRRRGEAAT